MQSDIITSNQKKSKKSTAAIFNIERHALHDGPGIRTLVFLKGCPLHCLWCSNPEGQSIKGQLMYEQKKCLLCGKCIEVCPKNSINMKNKKITVDRKKCDLCGECVKYCYEDALRISGKMMSVEEIMDIVLKDEVFYRTSGGGITVSGGEPTYHINFLQELLADCITHGIHTAIETCGYALWDNFERILPYTKLFLFDIKSVVEEKHLHFTGVSCSKIMENLKRLDHLGAEIIIRVPVIPEFNDSVREMNLIAEFIGGLSNTKVVHLLPFHKLGLPKYDALDMEFHMSHAKALEADKVRKYTEIFSKYNIDASLEI